MTFSRILRAAAAAVCALGITLPLPALAQAWPSKFLTLIVPFGAGSASDTIARIIGAKLSEELGQQVVIENVGGAGGMVGASRAAKAAPDGYTFLLGGVDTMAQNQTLYKNPLYNSATDFEPVALVAEQSLVLVVRKELPVSDLKAFAAYAKANLGKMQYASSGAGSASHLTCAQITSLVGGDAAHVAYRGSAAALQDLVAGTIDYYCALSAAAVPQVESKAVKAIATLTVQRSPFFPDLSTAREQGLNLLDSYFWSGFFLPKGTPADIIAKLNAAVVKAIDTPLVVQRMKEAGASVTSAEKRNPAYVKAFVASEIEKWAVTIKASGVKLD
jgi:tripartite-type tricarboxylate transporter receptor subunit TctC